MPLTRRRRELDRPHRRRDNKALPVQTRWHGVIIRDDPHRLNLHAIGLELLFARRGGILFTPVECACIGMHPEEAAMARIGHLLAPSFARVLVQILADHGVGDCLDHAWIRGIPIVEHAVVGCGAGDVEALVEF